MADITNITEAHRAAFTALTSEDDSTAFALFSCFVNGAPASAIVVIERSEDDEEEFLLRPLFVSVTPEMVLTDHEGVVA